MLSMNAEPVNILRRLLAIVAVAGGLSLTGAARAVTFDIGVGDFPRSFANLDNELASIVDSTGIVIVGALEVGGPVIFDYAPGNFSLSAKTLHFTPGTSLIFPGKLEIHITGSVTGDVALLSMGPGSVITFDEPGFPGTSGGPSIVGPPGNLSVTGSSGGSGTITFGTGSPPAIPEPSIQMMLLVGFLLTGAMAKRRTRPNGRASTGFMWQRSRSTLEGKNR